MVAWMRLWPLVLLLAFVVPASAEDQPPGATYEVVLQGAWGDAPDQLTTQLVLSFQDPQWIRGPQGRWVATYPVEWAGPERVDDGWREGSGTHYLDVADGSWVAWAGAISAEISSQDSIFDVVRTWRAEHTAGAAASFLPEGSKDCLLAPQSIKGLLCQVPGATGIVAPLHMDVDGSTRHLVATDGATRIHAWYEDGVPYATRLEVFDAHEETARMVLRLQDWTPWGPIAPAGAPMDLEPLRPGHDQYFIPSEAGVRHPYSLGKAIAGALAEPASGFLDDRESTPPAERWELGEYLASHQAFVYSASYMQFDDDPPDHAWTLGWTDGATELWVRAERDGDPAPLVNALLGADNTTFRYIDRPAGMDPYLPTINEATSTQPALSEMMRYWRAYSGEDWDSTQPNAWGLRAGCTGCDKGTWRFWAGHAYSTETISGNGLDTVTDTTTRESYIVVDLEGDVLRYEERVHVVQEGESIGPQTLDTSFPGIMGPPAGPPVQAAPASEAEEDRLWLPLLPLPAAALVVALWVLRREA